MIINMGDSNCKSSNMLLQSYSKETKKTKKKNAARITHKINHCLKRIPPNATKSQHVIMKIDQCKYININYHSTWNKYMFNLGKYLSVNRDYQKITNSNILPLKKRLKIYIS